MMNSYRMAQALHTKLLDDVAKMQRDIVLQTMIAGTFEHPLPIEPLLRSNNQALATGKETIDGIIKRYHESIREKTETIIELEAMFAEHNEAETKAFAEAMAERMRAGK
jgi:iron-sulfur cluster repair protein YtfE (RIC family)